MRNRFLYAFFLNERDGLEENPVDLQYAALSRPINIHRALTDPDLQSAPAGLHLQKAITEIYHSQLENFTDDDKMVAKTTAAKSNLQAYVAIFELPATTSAETDIPQNNPVLEEVATWLRTEREKQAVREGADWKDDATHFSGKITEILSKPSVSKIKLVAVLNCTTNGPASDIPNKKIIFYSDKQLATPQKQSAIQQLAPDLQSLLLYSDFESGEVLRQHPLPIYFYSTAGGFEKPKPGVEQHQFNFKKPLALELETKTVASEAASTTTKLSLHLLVESPLEPSELAKHTLSKQGQLISTQLSEEYQPSTHAEFQLQKTLGLAKIKKFTHPTYIVTHLLEKSNHESLIASLKREMKEPQDSVTVQLPQETEIFSIYDPQRHVLWLKQPLTETHQPALESMAKSIHIANRQSGHPFDAHMALKINLTLQFFPTPGVLEDKLIAEPKKAEEIKKPEEIKKSGTETAAAAAVPKKSFFDFFSSDKDKKSQPAKATDTKDENKNVPAQTRPATPVAISRAAPLKPLRATEEADAKTMTVENNTEVMQFTLDLPSKTSHDFPPFEPMTQYDAPQEEKEKKLAAPLTATIPMANLALPGALSKMLTPFMQTHPLNLERRQIEFLLSYQASTHKTEPQSRFLGFKIKAGSRYSEPEHLIFLVDHFSPLIYQTIKETLQQKALQNKRAIVSIIPTFTSYSNFKPIIAKPIRAHKSKNATYIPTLNESISTELDKMIKTETWHPQTNLLSALEKIRSAHPRKAGEPATLQTKIFVLTQIDGVNSAYEPVAAPVRNREMRRRAQVETTVEALPAASEAAKPKPPIFAKLLFDKIKEQFAADDQVLVYLRVVKAKQTAVHAAAELREPHLLEDEQALAQALPHAMLTLGEPIKLDFQASDQQGTKLDQSEINLDDLPYGQTQPVCLVPQMLADTKAMNLTLTAGKTKLFHHKTGKSIPSVTASFPLADLKENDDMTIAYHRDELARLTAKTDNKERVIIGLIHRLSHQFPKHTRSKAIDDFITELDALKRASSRPTVALTTLKNVVQPLFTGARYLRRTPAPESQAQQISLDSNRKQ